MTRRTYEIYYKMRCGSFLYLVADTLKEAKTKAKGLDEDEEIKIWINVCEVKKIKRIKVR